jgi:hypothetical protein
MIKYTLKCTAGHTADSWFQSASAYDTLAARGMVACPVCGSDEVEKALMTPRVSPAEEAAPAPETTEAPVPVLSAPQSPLEKALAELRAKVERDSTYVGASFATEARKMHEGEAPQRAIHGEARPDEARALIEDGVPVMPLPFLPREKAN